MTALDGERSEGRLLMRIDGGLLGWGVFLILLGGIPLAVNQGWLNEQVVARAWELWPLILLGIGISLLLRRTPLDGLGGLLVAGTFGIMLGSAFVGGLRIPLSGADCGIGDGDGVAFPTQDGPFDASARVAIELDCGEVLVGTGAGSGWTLSGRDENGQGPELEASDGSLRIASQDGGPFFGDHDDWEITLPTEPALDISVSVNAGSGNVDLAGARVAGVDLNVNAGDVFLRLEEAAEIGDLQVEVNAGAAHVTLPNAPMRGSVSANAGAVELCRSGSIAIRITTDDNIAAAYDFRGLVEVGDAWETAGFDEAAEHIELDARANAGAIAVDPEDGCNG